MTQATVDDVILIQMDLGCMRDVAGQPSRKETSKLLSSPVLSHFCLCVCSVSINDGL